MIVFRKEIDRPFTDDFFWEKPRKEMVAVLEESRADRRTVTEDGCSIGSSAIGF